ncbi:oxidoreductase [Bdellovibrio sp. NC01]|uniref:oxidoreductase n=1 Tax=Bdellovibrio sp. NC01 TaxID=2220073 RepID=UPI0011593B5D|nr:oxidoreductase [Bdellovibrio sp. NC01]QDK37079.1 oxidoreductase [Bdellovibrio sp. NC01]
MEYPTEVCLVGGSGLVGHELLMIYSYLDLVSSVKAISRSPLGRIAPKIDNIILDFDKMENQTENLKAKVFVCCLGSTIKKAGSQEAFKKVDYDYVMKFAKIAEKVGAQKFLVVSAMGANANSGVFYNRVKGEMERDLRKFNIPQIEIFRPSLILGERKEKRTFEGFAQKISPFMNKLLPAKYKAIQAKDIAKAMAIATVNFYPGLFIYDSGEIQKIADGKYHQH